MPDVNTRTDLALIVNKFYERVRSDETLAPLFEAMIGDWPSHIEKLTDFWEMAVFGKQGYVGNPIAAHIETDAVTGGKISPDHFGAWLNLWIWTIDDSFAGPNSDLMKFRARKMQTVLMVSIFNSRQ